MLEPAKSAGQADPAIAQVWGEGVEALPGCGKKAWGDKPW